VAEAHARDLRVLLDWVPNHSSSAHPWFVDSRSSRTSPRRDWYVWRDGRPDGAPPNNWIRSWSDQPAWTWDEATGQWYLHLFLPEQPDLNWAEPGLRSAMHDSLRFWLDRGVDGFRMDVIHCIGKDPALPDDPTDLAALSHVPFNDCPETHELLRGIRAVLDEYPGDRVSVGEVYLLDTAKVVTYLAPDELHLAFNFRPLYDPWDARRWRSQIAVAEEHHRAAGAWPTWVLSNHDLPRHRTRFGSEARARAAAVLLLTLRGTPFLYAGEELGLEDAVVTPERQVDPGGRDGCRAPFPWDASPTHGWATTEPWLPWPPDAGQRNVERERDDPHSMLQLYRRLLATRRRSPALTLGALELVDDLPDSVLGYTRTEGNDSRLVLVNFGDEAIEVDVTIAVELGGGEAAVVELASDGVGEGQPWSGRLAPDQAVVLVRS
jgi:alpha-glucosidase